MFNYLDPKWIKTRANVLRRDNYIDQWAKRFGKMKEATIVHHIFPVEEYPELAFEKWNLISLSQNSHRSMHKKNGEVSKIGKQLQEEIKRRYAQEKKKKL